ncbi:hypothetical protein CR513_24838, partial [Mucuna pruriens]
MESSNDQEMVKTLIEVMLETRHGLCAWHLLQNGIKHLDDFMKGGMHIGRPRKTLWAHDILWTHITPLDTLDARFGRRAQITSYQNSLKINGEDPDRMCETLNLAFHRTPTRKLQQLCGVAHALSIVVSWCDVAAMSRLRSLRKQCVTGRT